MKFLTLTLAFISLQLFSAEGGPCGHFLSEDGLEEGRCEEFKADHTDKASMQRGAKIYMNYCYGCHSLKYARYNRVARDLGIPEDLFQENLMFGDQKMGDLMTIGMDQSEAKEWFGVAPPDLTLETSLRGTDWVYTYLISFYEDNSRPFGVNNKVYENVGMPHVLEGMQGLQVSTCKQVPQLVYHLQFLHCNQYGLRNQFLHRYQFLHYHQRKQNARFLHFYQSLLCQKYS